MVKPKNGTVKRAARLVHLGAGLAGDYLSFQLKRPFSDKQTTAARREALQRKSARQVREELQTLRGPIMKVGQAFSMQSHLLGPEWIEELSALQMRAPAMHASLMRAQFKSAFGKYPEDVFRSFEPEPFAAASLGQVHEAVTQAGEEVVVKIQYPAIREAVTTDFKMLRTAGVLARFTGHLEDRVINEAERGFMEETDYLNEAKNIELMGKALAPLKFVRVPKVYRELSCQQVLTMSRVKGTTLSDFLKTNPDQELRNQLGAGLAHLFFFQLTRVGAMHADPHPGNYLLNNDGTIGLVDFGCVKHLKPEVVRCYQQFWSREWLQDKTQYDEIVRVLFDRKTKKNAADVRRCLEEIGDFYNKYHPLTEPHKTLDLGDKRFMDSVTELAGVLLRNKFLVPEFLFLARTDAGMCNLLHLLKAQLKSTQIAREYIPHIGKSVKQSDT